MVKPVNASDDQDESRSDPLARIILETDVRGAPAAPMHACSENGNAVQRTKVLKPHNEAGLGTQSP